MRDQPLLRGRPSARRPVPGRCVVSLLSAFALLVVPAVASAAHGFTEQIASARWSTLFHVPGWLDGRRRPSDRGDGQLHRRGDDARPQPAPQARVRRPMPGRDLQLGRSRRDTDAVRSRTSRACRPMARSPNVRDNRGGLHAVSVTLAGPGLDRSGRRSMGPARRARSARRPRRRRSSSTATPSSTAPPTSRSRRRSSASTPRSSSRSETAEQRRRAAPVSSLACTSNRSRWRFPMRCSRISASASAGLDGPTPAPGRAVEPGCRSGLSARAAGVLGRRVRLARAGTGAQPLRAPHRRGGRRARSTSSTTAEPVTGCRWSSPTAGRARSSSCCPWSTGSATGSISSSRRCPATRSRNAQPHRRRPRVRRRPVARA